MIFSRLLSTRSLSTHLALWFCLTSVVLTLVLVQIIGMHATSKMRDQIGLKLAGLAYQVTDKLDQGMYERYREFQLISLRPTLGDATISLADKQIWLEQIQQTYSNYSWIGITDLAGNVLAANGGLLVGADVSKRPWFGNALNNIHIGDVHDAKLLASKLPNPSGEPIRFVDVAFPYSDLNGRVVGVIGAHMSWKWANYVQESVITTAVSQEGIDAFIISQDGTVLLGPDKTIGSKLALASVTKAQGKDNEFLVEKWSDGKEYLVGYSASQGYQNYPGLGWKVLVRQEVSEAFAPVKQLQKRVLWVGCGTALLFSLFGLFNARRITLPLISLAHTSKKLRLGHVHSLNSVRNSYSQINELSASLTALVEQLQNEKDLLKELNASLEDRVQARTNEAINSEARLRTITNNIPALIAYADANQHYRFCNLAFQAWLDIPAERIIGAEISEVLGKDVYEQVEPHYLSALEGHDCIFEITHHGRNGTQYLKVNFLPDLGEDRRVMGVYILKQDMTDSKKHQLALQQDLLTDQMTGMPNRTSYLQTLAAAIARSRRTTKPFAVMFLDVDKFKLINDTYGHESGDKVLIEFGKRLTASIRETDTAARLAGDEFVVLIENLNRPEDAGMVAEKILEAVRAPINVGPLSLLISTSIGIAVSGGECDSVEGLMKRADEAMYQAKRTGRNSISYHAEAQGLAASRHF